MNGGRKMASDISKAALDALYEKSGLSLSDVQKATMLDVYPLLRAMIDRATLPMPREDEPAVTFKPEVK
jgi:hypothetical protein